MSFFQTKTALGHTYLYSRYKGMCPGYWASGNFGPLCLANSPLYKIGIVSIKLAARFEDSALFPSLISLAGIWFAFRIDLAQLTFQCTAT